KAHGVTLHIDPQHTAIPLQAVIVPDWLSGYSQTPGFDDPSCTGPDAVRFSDLEARYFQPHSNHPWHYAVFGEYVFGDPQHAFNCPSTVENGRRPPLPGMTGDSQVGFLDTVDGFGYDFVVALQPFRDSGFLDTADEPTKARVEGAIFMHELGHNLGLCHGGPNIDGCSGGQVGGNVEGNGENYKPNYISVMNYDFQFGIPYAATPGSTTIAGFRVDYSDVALPDLDETNLDETVGIQDTAHPTDITKEFGRSVLLPVLGPVDYNQDGNTTDTGLQNDLNGDQQLTVLHGADDWDWIHSWLTPPAVTGLFLSPDKTQLSVTGLNLQSPTNVIFSGGASAPPTTDAANVGSPPDTELSVPVPAGAKSGPVTVVTPEGKFTSSQSLTLTP
ncbi:MAG TPA: hypothetical protein VHS03_10095, partial [Gaiellaceae bacterium]|nr:hypothetical protein [Gaiellaceae bacterium]